jgi:hypothetical protein
MNSVMKASLPVVDVFSVAIFVRAIATKQPWFFDMKMRK